LNPEGQKPGPVGDGRSIRRRPGFAAIAWLVAGLLGGYVVSERFRTRDRVEPAQNAEAPEASLEPEPGPATPLPNEPSSTLEEAMGRSFPPPTVAPETAARLGPPPPPTTQAPVSTLPALRSAMDFERDKAAPLVPRLERMADSVERLGTLQKVYDQACAGTIQVNSVDRNGNQITGTISKAETPECVSQAGAISDIETALKKEGAAIQEEARTTSVMPGILRELVATYHLEPYLNP
jgi:hypothetical protein